MTTFFGLTAAASRPLPKMPSAAAAESEHLRSRLLCRAIFRSLDRDSPLRRSYLRQRWLSTGTCDRATMEALSESMPDDSDAL